MLGFAGSRKFPEAHGRALTRALLSQFGAQPLVSGLCSEGADAWCLEEALALRIIRNEDRTIWIGPHPLRQGTDIEDGPEPVWYHSTQRVRVADSTPCITAEVRMYPFRRDLGNQGGFARNATMAAAEKKATWLLLWDGASGGTSQMMGCLRRESAYFEVFTPACPVPLELRVVALQRANEAAFRIVYHGPKEVARVVASPDRNDLDLWTRPYADVIGELLKSGHRIIEKPQPWSRT
jgi:hypothetical protein